MPLNDDAMALTLGSAALAQFVFVLQYVTIPWWSSVLGRVLFSIAVLSLFVLTSASVGLAWDWPYEYEVRLATCVLLSIALWAQVVTVAKLRSAAAKRERERQHPQEVWRAKHE